MFTPRAIPCVTILADELASGPSLPPSFPCPSGYFLRVPWSGSRQRLRPRLCTLGSTGALLSVAVGLPAQPLARGLVNVCSFPTPYFLRVIPFAGLAAQRARRRLPVHDRQYGAEVWLPEFSLHAALARGPKFLEVGGNLPIGPAPASKLGLGPVPTALQTVLDL